MARPLLFPDVAERSIVLPDGRRLAWMQVGDPTGRPVLHFHGTPGCAAEATPLDRAATEQGVRLLAVDRPGIGGSDPQPGRTLVGWVDDVVVLADHLALDRPPVLGFSGGGPYALACGARRPERFGTVGVVSGAGPADGPGAQDATDWVDRSLTWLSFHAPRLGARLVAASGRFTKVLPGVSLRIWATDLSPADRRTLHAAGAHARDAMRYLAQAMVDGAQGVVDDERILALPWGFEPGDVANPVLWWHGVEDEIVPLRLAQWVAAALPDARFTVVPNAGHLLWSSSTADILAAL